MGNCCLNKESNESKPKQIKQYNQVNSNNNIKTAIHQSENFNIYDSVVKKLNFDDFIYPNENEEKLNEISFITSNKLTFNFSKIYLLGEGTFGKVFLVKNLENKKLSALKILDKQFISYTNQTKHTLCERNLLEKMKCKFIINLEYAFQSQDKLYFITEFAQGGELFFHLENESFFHIERVKLYIAELAIALDTLHSNGCLYRDLKPENILLDKNGHIKLTDFGLSKANITEGKGRAYSLCGTPGYIAPDIFNEEGYDKQADYFSLGLLMYQMIDGKSPFPELKGIIPTRKNKDKILSIFNTTLNYSSKFTEEAKSLCGLLLKVNLKERINNIDQIKSHAFFKEYITYDTLGQVIQRDEFDWEKVENKQYKPMFIPKLNGDSDVRYFSRFFTSQNTNLKESFKKNEEGSFSKGDYADFTYINTSDLKSKQT